MQPNFLSFLHILNNSLLKNFHNFAPEMTKDYRAMRTKWSLFLTVMTSIFLAGCMQKGAEDNLAKPQTKGKSNKEMLLSGDRTI